MSPSMPLGRIVYGLLPTTFFQSGIYELLLPGESFSAHTEQNSFAHLRFAVFFSFCLFFLTEANGQDLFLLYLMFSTQQAYR